jgi:hypothetical protein
VDESPLGNRGRDSAGMSRASGKLDVPFHCLDDFESFKLRMPKIRGTRFATCITMCGAERVRLRPRLGSSAVGPNRVPRKQHVVFPLWALEKVNFDETRYALQVSVA